MKWAKSYNMGIIPTNSLFPTNIALPSLVYLVSTLFFLGGGGVLRRPFVLRRETIRICLATITLSFHSQQQENTQQLIISRDMTGLLFLVDIVSV